MPTQKQKARTLRTVLDQFCDGICDNSELLRLEIVAALDLPHDLPAWKELPGWGGALSIGSKGSKKAPVVAAFKPRGFEYQSKRCFAGHFVLTKATPLGNEIELHVDVGSWSGLSSWYVNLNGPEQSVKIALPVSKRSAAARDFQYPINSIEQWAQIVANAAAVLDFVESKVVPLVDPLIAPTPPSERNRKRQR